MMENNGYTTKFMVKTFEYHPDLSESSWSMVALSTGTDDIVPQTWVTIDSSTSLTPTNDVNTNQSVIYVQSTTTKAYYQVSTQSISFVESNTVSVTPNLTCSFSPPSTSFSISKYGNSNIPSWVRIDLDTGLMSMTTPSVDQDTEYDFNINTNVDGVSNPVQKLIKLTVICWQLLNWQKCSSVNSSIWTTCDSGYSLISGTWHSSNSKNTQNSQSSNNKQNSISEASAISQLLSFIIILIVWVWLLIVTLMSLINSLSMNGLWAIINQIQLFFLLFLTRAFIPIDVQKVISGLKISLNIALYFGISYINFFNLIIGAFDFNLSNQSLDLLNIKSNSTIYNIFPIIILVLAMITLHLAVVFIYKYTQNDESEGRCKYFKIKAKKIVNKLFIIFTFGWYIRYILETNQYILISSVNEIYSFDLSDTKRVASLAFAIWVLLLCLALILFVFWLSFSSYKFYEENHSKLGEIFSGVKMQKSSKLYVTTLLIRRALFVVLLITLASIQSWLLISILSLFQFWYFVYITILRPFISIKDNIIEISNELYFSILLSSLIFLNSEKDWNLSITNIYMWVICSNSFISFFIITGKLSIINVLVDFIKNLAIFIKNGWSWSQTKGNKKEYLKFKC